MKKKAIISLLAALTAGSFLFLSGCGSDQQINSSDSAISAEAEAEHLTDGSIQMHSVWYNTDNTALSSASVTIRDGRDELFSGTTDESGNLQTCTLPGNTTLTCEITDSSGETLAEGEIRFRISEDYTSLTIHLIRDESAAEHTLDIPMDKTIFRAAIFLTEEGDLSFANLSSYTESDSTDTSSTEGDASGDTGTDQSETNTDTSEQTDAGTEGQTDANAEGQTDTGAAAPTDAGGEPAQ